MTEQRSPAARENAKLPVAGSICLAVLALALLRFELVWLDLVFGVAVFASIVSKVNPRVSVHMMFLVGYSTFLFFPAVANTLLRDSGFELLHLSSIVAFMFLRWTADLEHVQHSRPEKGMRILFSVMTLFVIVASFAAPDLVERIFAFYAMLFAMSLGLRDRTGNVVCLLVFSMAFGVYALVAWSGFGRVVLLGWLMVALLYFCYASQVATSRVVFAIIPPIASLFMTARDVTALQFAGWDRVLNDSAFAPYSLANSFVDHAIANGSDFLGLLDQFLFTGFVFIPRDWWPGKPYGFGFEYTVKHLDQGLVNSGHSIASTYIGEQLYYLGYWGILTGMIAAWMLARVCKWSFSARSFHGYGVVIMSCSMPVLVWGGMTSFSARVVWPLIVTLLLVPLVRLLASKPIGGRTRLVGSRPGER